MKTLPLVPYIRQSRKKEVTISLDAQREAIRRWAEGAGVPLAAEVVEQGVSGSKAWRERELGAVVAAVQAGEAAGIVVAYQDRLTRENGLGTAEVYDALKQAGARLVCAAEGLDTATGGSDAEMLFTIKAAIARHQWQRYQANWAVATEKAVAGGKYQGLTPVGFDRLEDGRLVKNGDAPRVEQAFLVRSGGGSWSEVARSLTGVETATSRYARDKAAGEPGPERETRWGVNSARSLLSNPIYKGTLKNGHAHHFPEYAVVTPSLWETVQTRRSERPGRKDAGSWALLGGLVFCAGCGHRLAPTSSMTRGKRYRYMQCKSIKCDARATVAADEVEPWVLAEAADYFEAAVEAGGVGTGRDTDVERAAELEQAVADAAFRRDRALLASGVSAEVLDSLESEVEAAKTALTDELGASRVEVTPEQFRAMLAEADLDERRMLVRRVIDHVTVTRGKSPVAERSEIEFRFLVW